MNTLTTSADSGASVTGAAGNDTFTGMVVADNSTGTTLTSGDNLVGGSGTDTLNITVSGASSAGVAVAATTLSGIEVVSISNFDTGVTTTWDHEFNAASWSGVTSVGLGASTSTANLGDTSITNLGAIAGAFMKNGRGDLSIDYTDAAVAGTSDTQALVLDGITGGTFTTDAGIETVAISAASTATKSTLAALSTSATKLTIDADVAVTITGALGTSVTTVDASASSAAVTLTISDTADYSVTGGTGNDVIDVDDDLTTADSLDGGSGTDTLVVNDASDIVTGLKVTNFETLRLVEAASADVSFISGITTIDYRIAAGGSGGATNVVDGTAVTISGDGGTITHTVKNASNSGVTNSLTVTLDNVTDATDTEVTALAAAGIETLNVVSSGVASPSTAATAKENSIGSVAGTTGLTTLNITGASDIAITTGANSTLATIDGSAATGRVAVTATAASIATRLTVKGGTVGDTLTGRSGLDSILGGAGNDVIDGADGNDVISGEAGNDTITGGSGNDTITGGAGNDTIDSETNVDNVDAGDGDDTVTISGAAFTNITSADTIVGGSGTDTLRFTNNSDVDMVTNIAALANVTGFEKIALAGAGANTLTINDLAMNILGSGSTLTVVADAAQSYTVNASGVLSSSTQINLTMGSAITSSETTTYSVGNAKDNLNFGAGIGAVTVATAGFLSANDTVVGGATVSDAINFTADAATTIDTTASTHILKNVTGVESINVNRTDSDNGDDYTFTLGTTFVASNYDATNAKFSISSAAGDEDNLNVNGSAVSGYNLYLSGGSGTDSLVGGDGADSILGGADTDTLTGGAGNDVITGGAGSDTITGGTGADRVVYTAGTEGTDSIVGFTLRGTATTAPADTDVIAFTAMDLTASAGTKAGLFDTNGADDGGSEVWLQTTAASTTAGTVVALDSADYNEITGGVAGTDTGLADNKINVVKGRGYDSLDAALKGNGVDDDGTTDIDGSFVIVFYNTATQSTEMHYVTVADGTGGDDGVLTTTSTQLATFTDISLTGVADFGYENFAVVSL